MTVSREQLTQLYTDYFGTAPDFDNGTTITIFPPRVLITTNATNYTGGGTSFSQSLQSWAEEVAITFTERDVPEWGWWTAYYPAHPVPLPRVEQRPSRPMRSQARSCAKQTQRWKRRRFLHKLRSEA